MTKTQLVEHYPEEFACYSGVAEDKLEDVASDVLYDVEMAMSMFLFENFGASAEGQAKPAFEMERLLALPQEKKEKFQDLVLELIGHYACWDHFGGE